MTTQQLAQEFDCAISEAAVSDSNLRIVERLQSLKQTALLALGALPPEGQPIEFGTTTRVS